MHSHRPDPNWDGGIRQMIAIAIPMVVSQACDTAMIFTGRLFLSKLGPDLMNAAMGGGLTAFMMMSFFVGLTGYGTAIVAQYFGAGRKQACGLVVSQAAIIALAAFLPILACRPLVHRLFEAAGIGPGQLTPQILYFDLMLFSVILTLLKGSLSAFFSGIGRTRIVMAASLSAMTVNIALSYVLVFGCFGVPAMGIRGAAFGTILGAATGLAVLAAVYLSGPVRREYDLKSTFRFDRAVMGNLLRFGSPTGLELFLNILAFNTLVLIFHSHGSVTATAATVLFNWDLVSFVPLLGIEIGVTSLVGRYMGARTPDRAHRAVMSGLKVGFCYSAVILACFIGIPHALVWMFRPSVPNDIFFQAVPLAVFMVRFASLYVLTDALLVVFIGALRGAGDTYWAMAISVSLHWLTVIALAVSLRICHLTPAQSWVIVVMLFVVFSFFAWLRYRTGRWKVIQVVDGGAPAALADEKVAGGF